MTQHARPLFAAIVFSAALALSSCASGGMPASAITPAARPGVPAHACFPVESLSPEDRAIADGILLTMGDGEGLYTLAGGLKPVSSGMLLSVRVAPDLDAAALGALEQRRRVAARLSCGEVGVFTLVFADAQQSTAKGTSRVTELVVYHRAALAAAVARHAAYFTPLGITPSSDAQEVLAAVEHAPRAERWRGYGYLYGYPDHAVDFFVTAGVDGDASGQVVPRDFRRIETWTKHGDPTDRTPPLSMFVYAVPKGAAETDDERALRKAAASIYQRYVEARRRFVSPASGGAIALWRAWLGA
jgi:hypothetical protein